MCVSSSRCKWAAFFFFSQEAEEGGVKQKLKVMHQGVIVMTEANDFGSLGVGNPPNVNLRQVLKRSTVLVIAELIDQVREG